MRNNWLPIFPASETIPIFQSEQDGYGLFYAPGVIAVVPPAQISQFSMSLKTDCAMEPACTLRQHAIRAKEDRENSFREVYAPLCLTLYLTEACDLACVYCYTGEKRMGSTLLSIETIRAAAEIVAENCRKASVPLTVVFHGGGEPTHNLKRLADALSAVEAVAKKYKLAVFRYIATSGLARTEDADWLAGHFDRVGLSCDGPETIQSQQRPRKDNTSSLSNIERTAGALHRNGTHFDVRVTVTQSSLNHQVEIAEYICRGLAPQEIHVEPIYLGGRTLQGLKPEMAEVFTTEFLRARSAAARYGINLNWSAGLLGDIHGPYCQIQRGVLNLLPDGTATTCFKSSSSQGAGEMVLGQTNHGKFVIDHALVERLRSRLRLIPEGCQDCFNQYHCVWDCPDHCMLQETRKKAEETFRCKAHQILTDKAIREQAVRIIASGNQDSIMVARVDKW